MQASSWLWVGDHHLNKPQSTDSPLNKKKKKKHHQYVAIQRRFKKKKRGHSWTSQLNAIRKEKREPSERHQRPYDWIILTVIFHDSKCWAVIPRNKLINHYLQSSFSVFLSSACIKNTAVNLNLRTCLNPGLLMETFFSLLAFHLLVILYILPTYLIFMLYCL